MFCLLRCLTAVSSRCKAEPGLVVNAGNWIEAGEEAIIGRPDLMAGVKDAVRESMSEHATTT